MYEITNIFILSGSIALAYLAMFIKHKMIESQYNAVVGSATKQAKDTLAQAQEFQSQSQENLEQIIQNSQSLRDSIEQRINMRSESVARRQLKVDKIHAKFDQAAKDLNSLNSDLKNESDKILSTLSKVSGLNAHDAKDDVKARLTQEFKSFMDKESAVFVNSAKKQSVKQAADILKHTMQRFTGASSVDKGTKLIEFKSKRAFEHLCGQEDQNLKYLSEKMNVEIERTDEKNTLRVSAFVIWHQETVKLALRKLISCSKITTEVIDRQLDLATREFEQHLIRLGNKVADILELENRHPELMQIIGRLKYRTSYGQNVLKHSLEVAFMAQIIASQIGANPREAFLGGFFHDLGKAIDQVEDGSHDLLGAEFLRKHDFPFAIYHPAESHHYAIPPETVEAEIVIIADKLSASRQGARTESAEMYLQRVQGLERIATEQEGVKKAYALSAGREIRSFVDDRVVLDQQLPEIAAKIAEQVSEELIFPGKIKVNLIRTFSSFEYANKKNNS